MKCPQLKELTELILDPEAADVSSDIRKHVETCPKCSQVMRVLSQDYVDLQPDNTFFENQKTQILRKARLSSASKENSFSLVPWLHSIFSIKSFALIPALAVLILVALNYQQQTKSPSKELAQHLLEIDLLASNDDESSLEANGFSELDKDFYEFENDLNEPYF